MAGQRSGSNGKLRGGLIQARSFALLLSFPNSVWERSGAKLCFASWPGRDTEFSTVRSQTEFGNGGDCNEGDSASSTIRLTRASNVSKSELICALDNPCTFADS